VLMVFLIAQYWSTGDTPRTTEFGPEPAATSEAARPSRPHPDDHAAGTGILCRQYIGPANAPGRWLLSWADRWPQRQVMVRFNACAGPVLLAPPGPDSWEP